MIRNNQSKISHKDSIYSNTTHKRGRSTSTKSKHFSTEKKYHKNNHQTKYFQKGLTQTTSSKIKRSQQPSPAKSLSISKKDKMQHILSDKISIKSMRKGRLGKQKTFMMQSLNIPHIDPLTQDEFIRNSSQQLTTNNLEHSVLLQPTMVDVLSRTQKIFKRY